MVSLSRIFVVPIEPKNENDKDIYEGLPIYEKMQLLVLDYLYEIQVNEVKVNQVNEINTLHKCIK